MLTINHVRTSKFNPRILLKSPQYICLRPHPLLKHFISNYSITFPSNSLIPAGFTTIPDGCATLAISKSSCGISISLDGPIAKPQIISGQFDYPEMSIAIEFKPAGLFALTGIDQNELAGQTIGFDAASPALSKRLTQAVEAASGIYELAQSLDELLIDSIRDIQHPHLGLMLQNILASRGGISIKSLSVESFYSERQLNRIFKQNVGLNAKAFSRLVRVNYALRLLKKPHDLMFISDTMGFFDLPHFIHDFKSVCGVTPQEYRNDMSVFYSNPTKF